MPQPRYDLDVGQRYAASRNPDAVDPNARPPRKDPNNPKSDEDAPLPPSDNPVIPDWADPNPPKAEEVMSPDPDEDAPAS